MGQPTLQEINERIGRVERYALIGAKPVLDLDEASVFTGFSKGHLYRLTSERRIPHYKKGRKLYFRKSELEEWLLSEAVPTAAEIERRAEAYLLHRK